jgi:dTDP-4-dehydrorhamnose reductase
MAEKVVVLGASGLIGRALLPALAAVRRDVELVGTTLTDANGLPAGVATRRLDVHDSVQLANLLGDFRPKTVVIATRFSRAADYSPEQMGMEVKLARRLAAWLEKTGGRLVLLSTASVFSGRLGGYREEDEPDPVTRYGETRAEMERQLVQLGVKHLVVRLNRTDGFRPGRETRFAAMWRRLHHGERVEAHAELSLNPLSATAAAEAIAALWAEGVEGTLHVAGGEEMTEHERWRRVAAAMGVPAELVAEAPAEGPPVRLTLDPTRARRKLKGLGVAFPPDAEADLKVVLAGAPS